MRFFEVKEITRQAVSRIHDNGFFVHVSIARAIVVMVLQKLFQMARRFRMKDKAILSRFFTGGKILHAYLLRKRAFCCIFMNIHSINEE